VGDELVVASTVLLPAGAEAVVVVTMIMKTSSRVKTK
jgi:hypothetical protein